MVFLGFVIGLGLGIGLWLWQQTQLVRYVGRVPRGMALESEQLGLPLIPRLRNEIASLKRQSQSLQRELQAYHELLEFAPVGYLQVDEENQLLWCNEQAREILSLERWQPGQVRLLLELVRSYELDQLIEQTRDNQESQVKEWVFHPSCENTTAMLEVKEMVLRATTLPLAKQDVGVFLENRQPLLEINQTRDRAFSDLAHELRTPLTSIRLVVETLQDRLQPPLNRWVDRLMVEVDRLINLVQSWLYLTQLEANPAIQLHIQPTELRSLIASVWESLEPLTRRTQIVLDYCGPETIWIRVDSSRMFQVFLNLLDNSIKYSPPKGIIRLEVKVIREKDKQFANLEINIVDSGVGFSPEDLPHVFERFYRGDKARSRSSQQENDPNKPIEGTGLGLAIVRQIILAHGGSIKAANDPQTGSAWLQIQLPQVVAISPSQDYI